MSAPVSLRGTIVYGPLFTTKGEMCAVRPLFLAYSTSLED